MSILSFPLLWNCPLNLYLPSSSQNIRPKSTFDSPRQLRLLTTHLFSFSLPQCIAFGLSFSHGLIAIQLFTVLINKGDVPAIRTCGCQPWLYGILRSVLGTLIDDSLRSTEGSAVRCWAAFWQFGDQIHHHGWFSAARITLQKCDFSDCDIRLPQPVYRNGSHIAVQRQELWFHGLSHFILSSNISSSIILYVGISYKEPMDRTFCIY